MDYNLKSRGQRSLVASVAGSQHHLAHTPIPYQKLHLSLSTLALRLIRDFQRVDCLHWVRPAFTDPARLRCNLWSSFRVGSQPRRRPFYFR